MPPTIQNFHRVKIVSRRGVEHPEFGEITDGDSVLLSGVAVHMEGGSDSEDDGTRQVYDECGLEYPRSSIIRIADVREVS